MKFAKTGWVKKASIGAVIGTALSLAAVAVPVPAEAANGGYCSGMRVNREADGGVYQYPIDANGNRLCRLDQGANSLAVKALQSGLNGACAVSAGLSVDGAFGAATRAALIRAQQKFGLTADGIYGPNTAVSFKWTTTTGKCVYSRS